MEEAEHQHSEIPLATKDTVKKIFAGKLYDSQSQRLLPRQLITVSSDTGLILSVGNYNEADERALDVILSTTRDTQDVIDLRKCTVMPGFVDAHVHRKWSFVRMITIMHP